MTTPAKTPFLVFKYAVITSVLFTALAWILLLGGISALQDSCPYNCRSRLGIAWLVWALQLVIIGPAFAVEIFDRFSAWRPTVTVLLTITTVLSILQANNFLDERDYYNSLQTGNPYKGRLNTTIAGFIILSIFNLLLIILSGSRTALEARYGEDRDVGVATYPAKPRPATGDGVAV